MAFRRDSDGPPRTWRRRLLIAFNVILATLLVLGVAAVGYTQWRFGQVTKLNLESVLRGDEGPGRAMNVLLVGSDSRANLGTKAFGTESQVAGQRSDTIMVLRVDPAAKRAAILSIPRDLWVPIAGESGKQRINTAFENGPEGLIRTIQQNLDIPIDHYAQVDFNGFRGIVNAIGGVEVRFDAPVRDRVSGLDIRKAGCVTLTGDQALAFVRSRNYEVLEGGRWRADPRADLGRIDRQQDFIRRVIRKAVDEATGNPVALNSLVSSAVQNLTIDEGFGLTDMTRLARRFQSLDPKQVEMMTLPTTQANVGGAAVLLPKQAEVRQTVERFLSGPPKPDEEAPAISPGSISVRVLNGSGVSGQASALSGDLKDAGFVISSVGDGVSTPVTVIRYAGGNKAKADVIASYLRGQERLVEDKTLRGVDAIITTGADFQGVATPGASPSTAAPATTSTTQSQFVPDDSEQCG